MTTPNWRYFLPRTLFGENLHAGRLLELDALRGLAILLAMGWHIRPMQTNSWLVHLAAAPGTTIGWVGVDLFFVLSGYLVSRMILGEIAATGQFSVKRFYIRRIFRLWPVLYTFIAAMVILSGRPPSEFLWQLSLHIQNYAEPTLAHHLWSLAVEEHFYVLFAILMLTLPYRRHKDLLIPLALGIILASPVLRTISFHYLQVDSHQLQVQTQFRLDAITYGVLLSAYELFHPDRFTRLLASRKTSLAVATICFAALWFIDKSSPVGCTLGFSISALGSAALFISCYANRYLFRFPAIMHPLAFLGVYSYTLYIWHVPVANTLAALAQHRGYSHPDLLLLAQYLASIATAMAVTRILERPFIHLRDHLFPMRKPPTPQPTVCTCVD